MVQGKCKMGPYVVNWIKWEFWTSAEGQEKFQLCMGEIAHYRKSPCLETDDQPREAVHQANSRSVFSQTLKVFSWASINVKIALTHVGGSVITMARNLFSSRDPLCELCVCGFLQEKGCIILIILTHYLHTF